VRALYPLFLDLAERRVLVVGGGEVAARKVDELIAAGARVNVVAIDAVESIAGHAETGRVELVRRAFREDDVEGAWLVVAATNDANVNREVARACEARRVFVNAVDDPTNASAFFASILRRPPFLIAISTQGELPALSRLLREVLESVLPQEKWIERARALRRKWRAEKTPMSARFAELVRALKNE